MNTAGTDFAATLSTKQILSYSSGLAPLKMYRELQRDMGLDRTVRIALYVFTRFTSKRVFVCSDERHTTVTMLNLSGLAVG